MREGCPGEDAGKGSPGLAVTPEGALWAGFSG